MVKSPQDERLMCRVNNLTYDFQTHSGELFLPESNCCDMTGCKALFESIDSQVIEIKTHAGNDPDVVYRKTNDGWKALLPNEY